MKLQISSTLILIFLAGCNYTVKTNPGGSSIGNQKPVGAEALSFADVQPILLSRCTTCHHHENDFKTYSSTLAEGDVKPGDAKNSALVLELQNFGGDMPMGQGPIPDQEANTIVNWINGGALETPSSNPPAQAPVPVPTPTQPTQPPTSPAPETVTFADVQPIFTNRCATCHHHADDFKTYKSTLGEGVKPGDAKTSPLVLELQNFGGEMPLKSGPIPNQEANMIVDWINGGALEGAAPAPVPPEETVAATYSDLNKKLFTQKCTLCHDDKHKTAGFSLEHYNDIATNSRLIDKNNAAQSGIYVSVAGNIKNGDAPFMPPDGIVKTGKIPAVTEAEKAALLQWILTGALDN